MGIALIVFGFVAIVFSAGCAAADWPAPGHALFWCLSGIFFGLCSCALGFGIVSAVPIDLHTEDVEDGRSDYLGRVYAKINTLSYSAKPEAVAVLGLLTDAEKDDLEQYANERGVRVLFR